MSKQPKYIHIDFNGWDTIASLIDDDEELELWLKDGSLKEDDVIFEVKRKFKVVKVKPKLLKIEEFGVE